MTIITRSDDLEILIAVVDSGGFTAAALLLNIQVAKVSRAVSRIEQQLGITLLTRTTRRIEVTEEGKFFITTIRDGLNILSTAEEQLKQNQYKPSGKLRIDTSTSFMMHQLIPNIYEFQKMYPSIELELSATDDIIDLLEKRTDIAIRIGQLNNSSLHAWHLGYSRLHIVATPAYLKKFGTPKTPEALTRHQCLGFLHHEHLNKWPIDAGLFITPSIRVSNGEIMRQVCLSGNGIACLSGYTIQQDLVDGHFVSILDTYIQSPNPREIVQAVYYRNSALSNRIKIFLDFIQPRLKLNIL